jgi:hypothetical protein
MVRKFIFLCLLFIFTLVFLENIVAHRVNLFAELDGNVVKTESFYSDGEKVDKGDIKVTLFQSTIILYKGKTDADGVLQFNIPSEAIKDKAGLKIILNVGMGHKAEWNFTYKELEESFKAYDDKTGNLIHKQEADNKIKKTAAINASKISFFQIVLGLALIWVVFGTFFYVKKKRKRAI